MQWLKHSKSVLVALMLSAMLAATWQVLAAGEGTTGTNPEPTLISDKGIYIILAMAAIVLAFLFHLRNLQAKFLETCQQEKQLALYFQSPAGLPEGSIRATIALLIVTISLFFMGLSIVVPDAPDIPQALSGLLGTVIGFYFGSRKPGGEGETAIQQQARESVEQRDQAVSEKNGNIATSLLEKANTGLSIARTVAGLLPDEVGGKYLKVADKIEQGVKTAQTLLGSGDTAKAMSTAEELGNTLDAEGPLADIVGNAAKSFGSVLGTAVPAAGLILALVAATTKLTGIYYQKWKARILHLPFSPAAGLGLALVDANTGFALMLHSPIFNAAYQNKLQDPAFLKQAADDFLSEPDVDKLLEKYGAEGGFTSSPAFQEGLEEFRRAAADNELKALVQAKDPALLGTAGGYDAVLVAVDKIHQDPNALKDLDALVITTEKLQAEDQPVAKMIGDILGRQ